MERERLEEFRFLIPGYTPETIPLPRLLDYLAQIAAVVGEELSQEMHLVRVVKSSAKPVFKMDSFAAAKAREQAAVVRTGYGTAKQRTAYEQVREMVRVDGRGKPAKLIDRTGVILSFEPAVKSEAEIIATVRQHTVFDGKLVRIGGAREDSTVLMETLSGEIQPRFTAARAVAKRMAPSLYDPIRVIGPGVWQRHREGNWTLANMRIQDYEPLADDDFASVLQKLREARVDWPDNADEQLRAEREPAL